MKERNGAGGDFALRSPHAERDARGATHVSAGEARHHVIVLVLARSEIPCVRLLIDGTQTGDPCERSNARNVDVHTREKPVGPANVWSLVAVEDEKPYLPAITNAHQLRISKDCSTHLVPESIADRELFWCFRSFDLWKDRSVNNGHVPPFGKPKIEHFSYLVNPLPSPVQCCHMRICVDARMLGPENTRGIGRYIEELLRALIVAYPADTWILVTRHAEHPFAHLQNVETITADIPWYSWQEQLLMPAKFNQIQADLFHFPHWNVPVLFSKPFVLTIHDLILRHEPSSAKSSTRAFWIRWVKQAMYRVTVFFAVRHARTIMVPTNFVKQDVEHFYPKAIGKTVVSGEGMPALSAGDHDSAKPPFLLSVGSAYPHKGLEDVLAVWSEIRKSFPDLEWHLVGEKDVFMSKLEQSAPRHMGIIFRGRLSASELDHEYRTATALIFPSHHEGFGLPVLEAIAHGCPVISSSAGPMEDVLGGDGAIFFRPGDSSGIISAVQAFFRDPERWGKETKEIAPKLASRHAWTITATLTYNAYLAVSRTHES